MLQGIDAQGRISNWSNVVRSGASFGIFRCVGENGAIDPDYAINVKNARSAGLVAGAYHFIAHGTVVEHCRRFVDTIGDPTGLLVSVDVERPNFHPSPTFDDVRTWFDEFRKHHPSHPVLIYTGRWFWHPTSFGNPDGSKLSPLSWGSFYPKTSKNGHATAGWKRPFGGWDGPTIWQYRGGGPLVDGKDPGPGVDLNAFRGTIDELRALTGPGGAGMEDTVITIDLERFPDGQRRVTGTNVTLFLPDRRTKVVPDLVTFANGRATILRTDNAAPKGSGWLRLSARPHSGWFAPAATVTLDPAAQGVGVSPIGAADLDRAADEATAEERGRWTSWADRHPAPPPAVAPAGERGRWETWLADRPAP